MGILDFFGKVHNDHQPVGHGRVKGPCAALTERGIDPAGLKFTLNEDGSVTVSGRVRDEAERDRICRVLGEMPLVHDIRNHMVIDGSSVVANDFKQTG
jgi:hypothetical protein